MWLRWRTLCAWTTLPFLFGPCAAQTPEATQASQRADSYIAAHGGSFVPVDRLEIDGYRMTCGQFPTVLDPGLDDFGAAPAGLVVLNPRLFGGLATPVKLWIFSHECAHQTVGLDEVKADCVAVRRGRSEGWLTQSGLEQVCEFMQPARGDQAHFIGTQRCALMRQCFQEKNEVLHR
jgi:hypothetical protein